MHIMMDMVNTYMILSKQWSTRIPIQEQRSASMPFSHLRGDNVMARFSFRKLMFKVGSFLKVHVLEFASLIHCNMTLAAGWPVRTTSVTVYDESFGFLLLVFHSSIFSLKRDASQGSCVFPVSPGCLAHGSFSRRKSCFRPLGLGRMFLLKSGLPKSFHEGFSGYSTKSY